MRIILEIGITTEKEILNSTHSKAIIPRVAGGICSLSVGGTVNLKLQFQDFSLPALSQLSTEIFFLQDI